MTATLERPTTVHHSTGRRPRGHYTTREAWVWAGIDRYWRPALAELDIDVPQVMTPGAPLISVGYGPGQRAGGSTRGRCYRNELSGGSNTIFVMPETDDLVQVLATSGHELVHALENNASGHKRGGWFEQTVLALGFERPVTDSGNRTPELTDQLEQLAADLGPFGGHKVFNLSTRSTEQYGMLTAPGHGGGVPSGHGVKQVGSRYFLAVCDTPWCPAAADGYKVRQTRIHVERYGPPLCPACQLAMTYDGEVAS